MTYDDSNSYRLKTGEMKQNGDVKMQTLTSWPLIAPSEYGQPVEAREIVRRPLPAPQSAVSPTVEPPLSDAQSLIDNERARQNDKWGEQNHDMMTWLAILHEETGELSEACLHKKFGGSEANNVMKEAIQVAAVGKQIVEFLVREQQTEPKGGEEPCPFAIGQAIRHICDSGIWYRVKSERSDGGLIVTQIGSDERIVIDIAPDSFQSWTFLPMPETFKPNPAQAGTPRTDAWCDLAVSADVSAVLELAKQYERELNETLAKLSASEQSRERMREALESAKERIEHKIQGKSSYAYLHEQFPATIGHIPLRDYFCGLGAALIDINMALPATSTDWVRKSELDEAEASLAYATMTLQVARRERDQLREANSRLEKERSNLSNHVLVEDGRHDQLLAAEASANRLKAENERLTKERDAWEQVWDNVHQEVPNLGHTNKPLAVAASYALLTIDRDSLRQQLDEARKGHAEAESAIQAIHVYCNEVGIPHEQPSVCARVHHAIHRNDEQLSTLKSALKQAEGALEEAATQLQNAADECASDASRSPKDHWLSCAKDATEALARLREVGK